MVGEPLGVVGQPVGVDALEGLDDASVQDAAALVEQSAVRDLVRQRVRERVLDLREELRLVDELRGAQAIEAPTEGFIRQLGNLLKDGQRDVIAHDGGRLQETLVLRSEAIDARRQHGLDRRRHVERMDRLRQAIPSWLSDQEIRLHQRSDGLFEEERIAVLDEALLQWREAVIGAEERIEQLARALGGKRAQPHLGIVRMAGPSVSTLPVTFSRIARGSSRLWILK